MKQRKNVLLLVGIIMLNIPVIMNMYEIAANPKEMITEVFLRLCGSVTLYGLVSLLAIAQFMCNCKGSRKPALSVTGICVSGIFILLPVLSLIASLPKYLIMNSLDLVIAEHILAQTANLLSAAGNGLLLAGYVQSLKRRE